MPVTLRPLPSSGRAARALILLAAFWVGLAVQFLGDSRLHCRRHAEHAHSHSAPGVVVAASALSCDHCPNQQCGATVSCAGGSSVGMVVSGPRVVWAEPRNLFDDLQPVVVGSRTNPPLTPPPQAIA
jgi:hypothetical protein